MSSCQIKYTNTSLNLQLAMAASKDVSNTFQYTHPFFCENTHKW